MEVEATLVTTTITRHTPVLTPKKPVIAGIIHLAGSDIFMKINGPAVQTTRVHVLQAKIWPGDEAMQAIDPSLGLCYGTSMTC